MTLDLSPGAIVWLEGLRYTVEEHTSFHEVDFRMDLVRLTGATPAHERWLLAVLSESYLMVLQRLEQDWLAPPQTAFVHDGERFQQLVHGSAHRTRRGRSGSRLKEGRLEYALFRADSGRVILTIGRNEQLEAWIGVTVPLDAVTLPAQALKSS